jgi:hypothetical protein
MPEIEFNATQGTVFTPLPKGSYTALIENIEFSKTKEKNNPQMCLIMRVSGGEYDGREVRDWMVTGGENAHKSGWRIANLLEATIPGEYDEIETGELNEKGKPLYRYKFNTDHLIGVSVSFKATIEEDNKGEDRNQFRYIAKTGATEAAKASDAQTQAGLPAAVAQTQPAQAAPATQAAAPATSGRRARLSA